MDSPGLSCKPVGVDFANYFYLHNVYLLCTVFLCMDFILSLPGTQGDHGMVLNSLAQFPIAYLDGLHQCQHVAPLT